MQELFRQPRHPYTRALLEAIPTFQTTGRLRTIPGTVPSLAALPHGCAFQDRCDRVQDRCRREFPQLPALESNQRVRCFYPEEGPC